MSRTRRVPLPHRAGCFVVGVLAASAPAFLHSREAPGLASEAAPSSAAEGWTGIGLLPSPAALQWPEPSPPAATGLFESRSPWSLPRRPAGAARVQSVSYPVDAGSVRVVPSVIVLPDANAQAPGLIAVGIERAVAGDPLRWKGQLGWSGAPSGSFEVGYREADRDVVVRGEDRPALAARLPGGRAPGSMIESRWSERLDGRTSASAVLTSDRLDVAGGGPTAQAAALELQHRPADHWTLRAGVNGAAYRDAAAVDHRRGTLTVATGFDSGAIGVTAAYRSEAGSSDGGGHGGRVSLRGAAGDLRASGFADVQQRAGIVEVELRDPTNLPRDLGELGLVGMRPEAAVQALRDRPALLHDHGLELGSLRSDALRVQGGIDVSWRPASGATQFGARVAYDGLDGPASPRRAVLGSLYTSWTVPGGVALTASYANWSLQEGAEPEESRRLFRMSLRAPL